MQYKQCPRCGAFISDKKQIHWSCVAARVTQKLSIPIGIPLVAFIIIVLITTIMNHNSEISAIVVYITPTPIIQNEVIPSSTNLASSSTTRPTQHIIRRATITPTRTPTFDTCEVMPLSSRNVNLRAGPNTDYGISGNLAGGQAVEVHGYVRDSDGLKWWQVVSGGWVREDLVTELGRCSQLSPIHRITHTSSATTTPTYRPSRTPTPIRTVASRATSTSRPMVVTPINATVNTTRINIRRGPGVEYQVINTVSNNNRLSLIGRNSNGSWVQINANDQQWVNASLLQINGRILSLPITYAERGAWGLAGRATGAQARALTVIRLRGCPSEDCIQLDNPDTLEEGDIVNIVGRSSNGMWYQVNVNSRSAWIRAHSDYIQVIGNTNANIPITD